MEYISHHRRQYQTSDQIMVRKVFLISDVIREHAADRRRRIHEYVVFRLLV